LAESVQRPADEKTHANIYKKKNTSELRKHLHQFYKRFLYQLYHHRNKVHFKIYSNGK